MCSWKGSDFRRALQMKTAPKQQKELRYIEFEDSSVVTTPSHGLYSDRFKPYLEQNITYNGYSHSSL